jgi:DsbC/DsbD-like thiol-disulfide interchange protein
MRHTVGRPVLAAAVAGLLLGVGYGTVAGQNAGSSKSDSKVKLTATAEKPGADGKQVITVKMDIDKGWHSYPNPSGNESCPPTVVKVEGKEAKDVKIEYPPGKLVNDKDLGTYYVWEDSVSIKVTVPRAAADSPVKLKVKFQACNESSCLPPATVELTVP